VIVLNVNIMSADCSIGKTNGDVDVDVDEDAALIVWDIQESRTG
jgi:hypothetical protein